MAMTAERSLLTPSMLGAARAVVGDSQEALRAERRAKIKAERDKKYPTMSQVRQGSRFDVRVFDTPGLGKFR